jgi:anti-sigma factor RsiW
MTNHDINHIVGRLLGPAGPEATCDECFDQLDAYVDREVLLGDAEHAMPTLAAHLRGCPACAEDHESLLALVRETHPRPEPGATR